jgi:hypothetical protein
MELLERYLQAVRFWLPKAQQNDIIAELGDDLRSQIEDKESTLGREITEDELASILQQTGYPMRVAARYQKQQSLIGPALFPIYKFVLKIVGLAYLVPWLLVWVAMVIFVPSQRADNAVLTVLGGWARLWSNAFVVFGIVTLLFAVLERFQASLSGLHKWDPRKLPALPKRKGKDKGRVPRAESVFELIFSVLFIAGWLVLPEIAAAMFSPFNKILAATPALQYYYLPVLLPTVIAMVQQGVNLVRPQWYWLRPLTRLVTTAIILGIVESMLKVSPYFTLVNPAKDAVRYGQLELVLNQASLWSMICFAIALCIALVVYAFQCVQIVRQSIGRRPDHPPAHVSQVL